jgi:hypothetical protein
MHSLTKKLAVAATATALIGAIGASVAQTDVDSQTDPMATPQQVDVPANASGQQIYFFRDQGNSPETDPAAHLLLIKHHEMVPVAERTTTTTVAQSTTPTDTTTTTVMPAASDTSNTETSASSSTSTSADTHVAMADETPALAPKADRN